MSLVLSAWIVSVVLMAWAAKTPPVHWRGSPCSLYSFSRYVQSLASFVKVIISKPKCHLRKLDYCFSQEADGGHVLIKLVRDKNSGAQCSILGVESRVASMNCQFFLPQIVWYLSHTERFYPFSRRMKISLSCWCITPSFPH